MIPSRLYCKHLKCGPRRELNARSTPTASCLSQGGPLHGGCLRRYDETLEGTENNQPELL